MVFEKFKDAFVSKNEKYEVLHHKYSKVKLDNKNLKDNHEKKLADYKYALKKDVALNLITLYEKIEQTKIDSYKVSAVNKDVQRLMMDINQAEKAMKNVMVDLSMEEISAEDKFYDPELHEIASYQESKGMAKGLILKTVRKGFKYKNEVIKKPRVVVTK